MVVDTSLNSKWLICAAFCTTNSSDLPDLMYIKNTHFCQHLADLMITLFANLLPSAAVKTFYNGSVFDEVLTKTCSYFSDHPAVCRL